MKNQIISASLAIAFLLAAGTSQARWMNPNSGRFHTMDTYEGNPSSPASLHKYLYSDANPVNRIDPSGNAAYYVQRQFDSRSGRILYPASGHGYLLFTDASDPGTGDPFATGQRRITSFSWHPGRWNPGSANVPGRIWEAHPTDMQSPGQHRAYLITADVGQQGVLFNHIQAWMAGTRPGYDQGAPREDITSPGNEIGILAHTPARNDGVYYSLYEQNCVWWAAAMLMQSGTDVPQRVERAIMSFNGGGGDGDYVIMGARDPFDVRAMGVRRQSRRPPSGFLLQSWTFGGF